MNGVICLGEALIDFIPLDGDHLTYKKAPGGAPANVAAGIAKLGGKSTFIGKVGDDVLGHFLIETLTDFGVDVSSMVLTDEVRTGVTFVTLEPSGERDFSFYIDPSADRFLQKEELDPAVFAGQKIFHFGSISLISEPAKSATLHAAALAKNKGMLTSYDPNLRLSLWDSAEQAKETILAALPYVDLLKMSEEELLFLSGCDTLEEGMNQLPDLPLIVVTLGEEGSLYRFQGETGRVPAMDCKVVDTTGAGDAFVSGFLYSLNESQKGLAELSAPDIAEMLRFANVSGGLATTKKGALTGLPTLAEIQAILK